MKKLSTVILLVFSLLIMSCSNQQSESEEKEGKTEFVSLKKMNINSLEEVIKKREAKLGEDSTGINPKNAASLLEAYYTYSDRFPNRANSADRLFKAAELAMSLNHGVQAIKYFAKVYDEYPDYEKRAYALFLKAFVLENQAKDYEQAKNVYNEFILKYPEHPMADDAEYSLRNMGKSPEELIREFEIQDSIRKMTQGSV